MSNFDSTKPKLNRRHKANQAAINCRQKIVAGLHAEPPLEYLLFLAAYTQGLNI